MGLSHKLPIIQRLKREVEMRGYCLAQTNGYDARGLEDPWKTVCRVYRSDRDKGKPERALLSVDTFNRYTVPDVVGALLELEYNWKTGGDEMTRFYYHPRGDAWAVGSKETGDVVSFYAQDAAAGCCREANDALAYFRKRSTMPQLLSTGAYACASSWLNAVRDAQWLEYLAHIEERDIMD